ncbi:MAG: GNAT family N-acetyltransferase [Bacillota bacterium]
MTRVIAKGSTFVIERVGPADEDRLLTVYRQCEDFLALGPVPRASGEMVQADLRYSSEHGGMFGVIIADGEPIGVVDYEPSGHDGDPARAALDLLMLAASHRGKGVGAEVVALVEQAIAHDPAVTSLTSWVQVNNERAIAFWRRQGYEAVSGPRANPDGTTVYELRKRLPQ